MRPVGTEFPHRPSQTSPLIEIAKDDLDAIEILPIQSRDDCANLIAPSYSGQVKMGAYDLYPLAFDCELCKDSTARLQCRKRKRCRAQAIDVSAHQDRITMPADTAGALGHRKRSPLRIIDERWRKDACPIAETQIGFLQGNYIGVHLSQHGHNALGIAPPVEAHGFVNIVAGEFELH